MKIKEFYDKESGTWTYLVFEREGSEAIVIDSVLVKVQNA